MSVNGLNDQAIQDARNLITGKDGRLYVMDSSGQNHFLAQVNQFQAQMSVTNTDYQAVGSPLVQAVTTGYSVTLTITEAVVSDDPLLVPLLNGFHAGAIPEFNFQGYMARSRDGQSERVTYEYCVADGTIDLQNLQPGDIITRAWSFRCNASPQMIEQFKDA
jgi:hypothetical protein